jgi:hypothetical protein
MTKLAGQKKAATRIAEIMYNLSPTILRHSWRMKRPIAVSLTLILQSGIRRVKGVRRFGVRVRNWLTAEEGKKLLSTESRDSLRSCRNRALLALLIGCGLRRAEERPYVSRIFNFGKVIG